MSFIRNVRRIVFLLFLFARGENLEDIEDVRDIRRRGRFLKRTGERALVLDLTKICITVIVCEVRVSRRRVIDRPEPSIYIFVMAANKDAFPFRVTFILTPSWRDLYTWSRVKYKLLGIIIVTRSEQETRFERA